MKRRLKEIRRIFPECAWDELGEAKDIVMYAGRFATIIDLADDMMTSLIFDIDESIREDKRLRERWKAEREAKEAEQADA